MTSTAGANAQVVRVLGTSSSSSFSSRKPNAATQHPFWGYSVNPKFNFSPLLSLAPTGKCGVYSISKENGSNRDVGLTYKEAGVDIDAGSELVRRIAKMAPGIGGFGGLYPLGDSFLVAGTDGVGTKLKLAFETGIHETIGIDLVAMSVNDIVTSGAKPLFFLDYFATSRLDVDLAEKVIAGIVDGCQQSNCTLLGGETAEMPDFYKDGEYDLSGFAVGIVRRDSVIDGKSIVAGDVLIGLPASGVHSNGFSLVRRVLAQSCLSLKDHLPGESVTLGKALMAPTVIYVKQVLDLISKGGVKGIAHITGGGFTDNIPRVFPKGLGAAIYSNSWEVPAIFRWIQEAGRIEDAEMRRTFNMGIGMVLIVSREASHRILEEDGHKYKAYRIGEVVSGEGTLKRSENNHNQGVSFRVTLDSDICNLSEATQHVSSACGSNKEMANFEWHQGQAPSVVARGGFSGLFLESSDFANRLAFQTACLTWLCFAIYTQRWCGLCQPGDT